MMSTLYFVAWFFYARDANNAVYEYGPYRDEATCNLVREQKDEDDDHVFVRKSKCVELQKMSGGR